MAAWKVSIYILYSGLQEQHHLINNPFGYLPAVLSSVLTEHQM